MSELILVNGNVRTGQSGKNTAESIAIRDGRVLAVGGRDEMQAAVKNGAEEIDLDGATVIPGLIDPHNHLLATGELLGELVLYDVRSIGELQERLRQAISTSSNGTWIAGRGWDETLLAEQRMPTRHDLDIVSPNHPVVLHRVWNKLVVNTCALRLIGIDEHTPDPSADVNYAGSFDREEGGYPTGIFRDRAKELVLHAMPQPSEAQLVQSLVRGCKAYNALGLTAIVDPGLRPHQIDAYRRTAAEGLLTVRSDLLLSAWGFVPAAEEPELEEWIKGMRARWPDHHPFVRVAGVKMLPDGGIGDRTARVSEAFVGEPNNFGVWAVPADELPHRIRWVHNNGWSMDIHTCGDEAQKLSVKAFADAQEANPNPDLRHRVHHAYLPTPDTLERMAKHRVPAVVSTPFIRALGESFVQSLGEERAAKVMPFRTYLDYGVPLAGSSDSPVADYNPWIGMATALERRTVTGRMLGESEVLNPGEALALYTSGAAFAMGRENELGQLSPGFRADLVVLENDVFASDVAPETMAEARPTRVMLDGSWVL